MTVVPSLSARLRAALVARLGRFVLTVLLAVAMAGALIRLAPGFGMDERMLDPRLSEASRTALEAENRGADGFWPWLGGYAVSLTRGEFGRSTSLNRPVGDLLAERGGLTARNMAGGLALGWVAALGAALALLAWRRRTCDLAATAASSVLLCLPAAVLALLAFYAGAGTAVAIGAVLAPRLFRYVRSLLSGVERRPHVLAARARGISGIGLLLRHICWPAAPELVALAGLSASLALGAAIPVEVLCDSPGLGQLAWMAATARDLPVLVNMTVVVAAVTAGANLLADATRAVLTQEA